MSGFLTRLRSDTSGNALMIFAGALMPLFIVIGGAVDMSVAYMTKARMQNACDAAVLAGRMIMQGTTFNQTVKDEADKFFDFNFPAGTLGTRKLDFQVTQSTDLAQINGVARAQVPTPMMSVFGHNESTVSVACDATRDLGNNDIMLVLDVTGSMGLPPAIGGTTKIERLRDGAMGLYRALDDKQSGATTRFGIVPYSHTVNVARLLDDRDIVDQQMHVDGTWRVQDCASNGSTYWNCQTVTREDRPSTGLYNNNTRYRHSRQFQNGEKPFAVNVSTWGSRQAFRTSGAGCIEERTTAGNSDDPIRIGARVFANDVDMKARNFNDTRRQFGRYDPARHENAGSATNGDGTLFFNIGDRWVQTGCPGEASGLREYSSESAFKTAINSATSKVTGGTYHDIGLLWGARLISRTGMFAALNPTERNNFPVDQHIVFMTDGKLDTGARLYSAFGIQELQNRVEVSGTLNETHISRFNDICNIVRSRGVTVWVIALDETDTDDIARCATTKEHFYVSDGSDLEEVFEAIGRGIGNLRLTR